jgi:hypothetical protein
MEERNDKHPLVFDPIDEPVPIYENLADGWIVQLGQNASSFGEGFQTGAGR